jgi:hypothetical protein
MPDCGEGMCPAVEETCVRITGLQPVQDHVLRRVEEQLAI